MGKGRAIKQALETPEGRVALAKWAHEAVFELLSVYAGLDVGHLELEDGFLLHVELIDISEFPDMDDEEFLIKMNSIVAKMAVWATAKLVPSGGGKISAVPVEFPETLYVGFEIRVLPRDKE